MAGTGGQVLTVHGVCDGFNEHRRYESAVQCEIWSEAQVHEIWSPRENGSDVNLVAPTPLAR
jgi:hypothetical protein